MMNKIATQLRIIPNAAVAYLLLGLVLLLASSASAGDAAGNPESRLLLLTHYMPWFEAKPVSPKWGWHWTMNYFDPEMQADGKREIASHFHPLIGPYDSSDVAVLEYQLLTMKLAGIDGVIVDWYGLTDFRDYVILHRNTTRMLETAERLKMKFVICYEDQTVPALVEGKRIKAEDRVAHAANEIQWLSKYWFKSPSYLLLEGQPVLLSFGQTGLTNDEWSQCLKQAAVPVKYFSQQQRRSAAVGAFDWPIPSEPLKAFERFHKESRDWPHSIPVAYPRFVDIYAEAKVGPSYGRIDDDKGRSFRMMLERVLRSNAAIVQLATWNDWGEGTQIEPSHEFDYRDLETVQEVRRQVLDPTFAFRAADLRLPQTLLDRRRQPNADLTKLDRIAELISSGRLADAKENLDQEEGR